MSFVDLLFPREELEALGNRWHQPTIKRRKLDLGVVEAKTKALATPRRQNSESVLDRRRCRLSSPSYHSSKPSSPQSTNLGGTKRSYSESQSSAISRTVIPISTTNAAAKKSFLPSFIEPSILKNYLKNVHPNDRSRYSLPSSPRSETQFPKPSTQMLSHQSTEELASSPGSLISDSSSHSPSDSCAMPAAICERFRSGPFGHLFDGMRITDIERDMMEDLLNPAPFQDEAPNRKRKDVPNEVNWAPEDYYDIDEALLQKMFPAIGHQTSYDFGLGSSGSTNADRDYDVHSSGLSPAAVEDGEEEKDTTPKGFVIYDYSALSVDDFFDLDEASSASALTAE